jgi:hypothetical protein
MDKKNISDEKFLDKNSELIIKSIIEKLISYTIFEVNRKDITSKINSFCFQSWTKKLLNSLIYPEYICHDKDEFTNANLNKIGYFFDDGYYGENNWISVEEPVSN